ncbi:MAG: hypothetical protein PHH01_01160 [Patescibacteria group bacterium]|nr:hypothetical protein [Patescibacteria group bacterium]
MKPIGSRRIEEVRVYGADDRPGVVQARVNLFGTDIGVATEPIDLAGCLLVPRWEDVLSQLPVGRRQRYRWEPTDLRCQVVGGAYKALRQQVIVCHQYGLTLKQGEKSVVLEARTLGQRINSAVVGLRQHNVEEVRASLQPLIREILEQPGMTKPRSLPKREIQRILAKLERVEDSLGRANPGALIVEALRTVELTDERLLEAIMRVEPIVVMRRQVFINLIQWAEWIFGDLIDLCDKSLRPRALRGMSRIDVRRLQGHLWEMAQRLDGIDYYPYVVNARYCARELRSAAACLASGEWREFRSLITRALMSARIKQAQILVERVIYRLLISILGGWKRIAYEAIKRDLDAATQIVRSIDESGFSRQIRSEVLVITEAALDCWG